MACVRKRRDRWVIDFYDQDGVRRWQTMPEGSTKKRAKEKLKEIEEQVGRRAYLPVEKVPTFEKVAEDWLEHKKLFVRQNTWRSYRGHVEHHFSEFNNLKVDLITTGSVEKFIKNCQDKGMNLTTLRRVLVTLNQTMKYAVRHRYIAHNPVRDAERPTNQGEVEEQKIRILTPSEIRTLLDAEQEEKYRTLFRLSIFSGARQGELLGLKWTDMDWFNKQIHIQRTFNQGRWYSPKSKASNRKIDLGPVMMAELRKWRIACPASELDLIFPNGAGQPINHANMLSRHFYPALKDAGLPHIRFHDLRHTYASLLIERGENVKYIQSQLGHSNPTVTLNVYAHLMNPTNPESAEGLEEMVLGNGSKTVAAKEKGSTSVG